MGARHLILVVFALALLAGCGGGEDDPSPAQAQREAKARAEAQIEARNEEVIREYRERNAAQAPTEEEKEGRRAAAESYRALAKLPGLWFVKPTANVRAGLEAAQGNEALAEVCELMSAKAQEETTSYAEVSSGIGDIEWTCEKAMALLVRRAFANGAAKRIAAARIVSVNAEGDRATATVSYGKGVPLSTIPLEREDGEWKLGSSPAGS